jgi:hypothetical protein
MSFVNSPGSGTRVTWISCILLCILLAAACSGGRGDHDAGSGTDPDTLRERLADLQQLEKALQQESALARKSDPYIVLNLQNRMLELKAKGRNLRSFQIRNIENDSGGIPGDVQTVSQIKPYQVSSRPKIDPGKGESATLEAAQKSPWGLHRMPLDYDLVCKSGLTLQFRALPSEQAGNRLLRFFRTLYRRILNLYRQRNSSASSSSPAIQIWLDENDCRLLFWSIPKQPGIILVPGSFSESQN